MRNIGKKKTGNNHIHNILKYIYIGINLTKKLRNLYNKNLESLKKEIEEDARRWNCFLCSFTHRINNVKMTILAEAINRCNTVIIEFPLFYFSEKEKNL